MKTDLELQQDVMEELRWESFLKSSEIGVSVKNGIVTLSGYVDSFNKKKAAERAALRVAGVLAVAEDIVVKLSASDERSDTAIAQAIADSLKWHSAVQEDKIKIQVDNGWVTLNGTVDWAFQRDAIKNAIVHMLGVKGITDHLSITEKVSIPEIKKKISAAFHRSAGIDANNISVEEVGNRIILRGTVRSYAEKREAERAAWNAPGVIHIDNKLNVVVPIYAD